MVLSCGDDTGVTGGLGGGTTLPGGATASLYTSDTPFVMEQAEILPIDDGLIVAASLPTGALVSRFSSEFDVVWQVDVTMPELQSAVLDASDRIVLVGSRSVGDSQVVRLSLDGDVVDAFAPPSSVVLTDVVPLANGDLMFNTATLVDENFAVKSQGDGRGVFIAATPDGFATLDRDLLTVRGLDEAGFTQWTHRIEIPAANYYPIGLRVLPDGDIVAATSGDVNPRNVLLAARLGPDGALRWVVRPQFEGMDSNGFAVPLQFGRGIDMAGSSDTTLVSFVANSGTFGSDLRTRILAELDNETGVVSGATFGGGGLVADGGRIASASATGLFVGTELNGDCIGAPTVRNEPFEVATEPVVFAGERPAVPAFEFTPVDSIVVASQTNALTLTCPADEDPVAVE